MTTRPKKATLRRRRPKLQYSDVAEFASAVGPSSHVFRMKADSKGTLRYSLGPDRKSVIRLGEDFASRQLGILHTLRGILLFDPATDRLLAFAYEPGDNYLIFLFGDHWGWWVDQKGKSHPCSDTFELMRSMHFPFWIDPTTEAITFEFYINLRNREAFAKETRRHFREGSIRYQLAMTFSTPAGDYQKAKVIPQDSGSGMREFSYEVIEFPILWPKPYVPPAPEQPVHRRRKVARSAAEGEPSREARARDPAPADPGNGTEGEPRTGRVGLKGARPAPDGEAGAEARPHRRVRRKRPASTRSRIRADEAARERPRKPEAFTGSEAEPKPAGSQEAKLRRKKQVRAAPSESTEEPPKAAAGSRLMADRAGESTPFPNEREERWQPSAPSSDSATRPHPRPAPPVFREPTAKSTPARKRISIPPTEQLAADELVRLLESESDPELRWKIIEANLLLGRPERTYLLISNFPEMISEQTCKWPPARLRTAFQNQAGGVLISIMEHWSVNQVLGVSESVAESDKIITWLREHELDRLLRMSLDDEPASAEAARQELHIDRFADPPAIRRAWRMLLQFLHADLGRRQERAIHRKKDEIAKHLQVARDVLLRNKPR